MKRRDLIKYLSVVPLAGAIAGSGVPFQSATAAPAAKRNLIKELGIRNVRFRHGDGTQGWKGHAPFDGILVAAAPLTVPEALLKQLKVGGRLLVPVGPEGEQQLVRFTRREQRIEREALGPVAFVPLLGGTA